MIKDYIASIQVLIYHSKIRAYKYSCQASKTRLQVKWTINIFSRRRNADEYLWELTINKQTEWIRQKVGKIY